MSPKSFTQFTHKFEVEPRIFWLKFWPRPVDPLAVISAEVSIKRAGGTTYLGRSEIVFFGFPQLSTDDALTHAARIQQGCAREFRDVDISVSVSTFAANKWKRVLAAPWDFVGTGDLAEALTAGVQFNRLEPSGSKTKEEQHSVRKQTFPVDSLKDTHGLNDGAAPRSTPRQLTEEEIQA